MVGQTLSHYRVVEQIGAGGMGVVYRAQDEQLGRDVALKVLPSGMLADQDARRRFRREALALARLNHPNIGAVYEFGSHEGIDFLVMELVGGVTLDTRLSGGSLPENEVLRLAIQLGEALEAAHAHKIVHRDLKPSNLRLTNDGRLKLLDFGLAQATQPDSQSAVTVTLTKSQQVSGTVPYMAPEQLRGHQADARSDIYSAGTVLYEMATGSQPFHGISGPQLIGAILENQPPPPSSHNKRISPALESIILKAIDKDPNRRYQSARELRIDLERVSSGLVPRARHLSRVWALATAGLVVAIMALAFTLNLGQLRDRWRGAAHTKSRPSVAVLGFRNLSGNVEQAWISTALSEMLTTELAVGEKLRTIPGENVARAKDDLSLTDSESLAPDTLAQIRQNLGADFVVLGSYLGSGQQSGNPVRLDLRIQDTKAGVTIASIAETGTQTQLLDLVSRAGADLRTGLGIGGITPAEAARTTGSLPADVAAARLYAEGLARLRTFDNLGARDLLERTVNKEQSFALAHAALAEAWANLGYDTKANQEAKRAFELSENLPREERLSVEGRFRQSNHEWDKAIEIYRTLFDFFPDNLEYGLKLSRIQISGGRAQEALGTIGGLRKLPSPVADDPRIDYTEASAYESLADYKGELLAADRAVQKGQRERSRLLVAQAHIAECFAFQQLGELEKAMQSCGSARSIYAEAGDRHGQASALNSIASTLYQKGDLDQAASKYQEALASFREVGDQKGMASTLSNFAAIVSDQGRIPESKAMYEKSLAISREIGDDAGVALALGNIGAELFLMGDLGGARGNYDESISVLRRIGATNKIALWLSNLAETLRSQGELNAATSALQEALGIDQAAGNRSEMAFEYSVLGDVLLAKGNLAEARQKYETALHIRTEIGEKPTAAENQVSLGELSVEEGHAERAPAPVRDAIVVFESEKLIDDEIFSAAVLAKALLALGKAEDAEKELARVSTIMNKSHYRNITFKIRIIAAQVRAELGKTADASTSLEAILSEAGKLGFVGQQLDARLALGVIELKSGKMAAGRARLAALEKDARSKGFLLVAQKAAAIRTPSRS
jgi:tetratricopeptide (TPR) repeat protein/TolB-like protein